MNDVVGYSRTRRWLPGTELSEHWIVILCASGGGGGFLSWDFRSSAPPGGGGCGGGVGEGGEAAGSDATCMAEELGLYSCSSHC